MNTRSWLAGVLAVTFVGVGSQRALAQSIASPAPDSRWTPYLGCWRLLADNVRGTNMEEWARSAVASAATPAMTVCVEPSGAAGRGVTMVTFADKARVLDQTVTADGGPHSVSESGCTGSETSDWSRDGLRLFTHVELACSGRPAQTITGITLFVKGPTWVDIQTTDAGGNAQVRIRRYTRVSDRPEGITALPPALAAQATLAAHDASLKTLSLEDVTEASAKSASDAVEAAIVETSSRFSLNSKVLTRLADAGVSSNVIDLMVAQSFPTHFRVDRPSSAALPPVSAAMPPLIGVYSPYGIYDPYAYYSYYYSPFAYPYYWGSGYYYRGPTYYINGGSVISGGSDGSSGGGATTGNERGLVVNGRGYTRVHTNSEPAATTVDPAPRTTTTTTPRAVGGTTSGTGADSSGSTSSSGSSSSSESSTSSGSSSSGGVTSSGGYSGGSSGDSGRTAQPR